MKSTGSKTDQIIALFVLDLQILYRSHDGWNTGNSFFFLEQRSGNPLLAYEHWLALHFSL